MMPPESTLARIHQAARSEFREKGFQGASLRNIVKSVGMTTGAFYGYYKSKEALFEALVGAHYRYLVGRFCQAQKEFARLPRDRQPEVLGDFSGACMFDMLHYAYDHLEECSSFCVPQRARSLLGWWIRWCRSRQMQLTITWRCWKSWGAQFPRSTCGWSIS